MNIRNNKILITGGNSGIGKEMVKQLSELGNHIIIVGRNEKRLEEVRNEFDNVEVFKCDISKKTELDDLVLFIEQNHTDLNILINNAGIQYNYQFNDGKDIPFKIENEIQINLIAPLRLISLLTPILEDQEKSAIVNVSSGLALVPKQSAPVYCATKAGIHIFSKSLRYQLENTNIKVFEIIPSLVATPMTEGRGSGKITPKELVDEFIRNFKRDKLEINIGKTKLLRIIQRISPRIADNIMRKY